MVEGKLSKHEEESKEGSSSPIQLQDALRLPNISLKGTAENIIGNNVFASSDGYASPTNLLQNQA